ncbi:hypothetical protein LTR86_006354 [Recurvomyces mirabilis]|nr:hypothetical protein LTR86_006354 [Recurvomyces mirabilis]
MSHTLTKPTSNVMTYNPWNTRSSPYYNHIGQSLGACRIVTPAGQVGILPDGSIPTDPSNQIRVALSNLSRCLEAAGADVTDIIRYTQYIVDYDYNNPVHREPLQEFLGEHRPPSTLIPVTKLALPGLVYEIEITAAVPQFPIEKVDVVVVGAGLSGLQTAVNLQKAGLQVKVLEARDRIGGKTWSRPVRGSICDVGAAWINDTNQSKMYSLAQRYKLDLIEQNTDGSIVVDEGIGKHKLHPYGELIADDDDKEDIEDAVRVRNVFEETLQQIDIRNPVASGRAVRKDLDSITFEEWIKSLNCRESAVNALTVGARAMLGVEPADMSALYFLDYCKSGGGYLTMRSDRKDGGQYLRIRQGTQSFSTGLANELESGSIVLQSPVRVIRQEANTIQVMSARGSYEASRVVVSVPTPMYGEITFDPLLPQEKIALATSTRLGDYCKVVTIYDSPWWREHGLTGMSQSVKGPFTVTRDTSIEADNHFSLTCFVVGQLARDWMLKSPDERQKTVLGQIERLFGPFAKVQEPIEVVEQIWQNEQWSQGCPCPVMSPEFISSVQKRRTNGKGIWKAQYDLASEEQKKLCQLWGSSKQIH